MRAKDNYLSELPPSIIVIFGITGDLSRRYLLPALYHLIKDNLLDSKTVIIGISRREISVDELLSSVELSVNEADGSCDPKTLKDLHHRTRLVQMNLASKSDYDRLLVTLNDIEQASGVCMNRLYYLSIPPQVYSPIINLMGESGLDKSCLHGTATTRLLVEKPFGFNLTSARDLINLTAKVFREDQIFRIDHYLAKETVQNIITFRFQNPIFEALWSRHFISSIEIYASEQIDISGREHFYEPIGALKDFIQSHLLQLLGIVTMKRPRSMDSRHIHDSKQAILEQIEAVPADLVSKRAFRGQYEGYKAQVANAESTTETFAAVKLFIDNDSWHGVPIIIWTGKALAEHATEIIISFDGRGEQPNRLRFRIQPNEGIQIDLLAKKPGFLDELQPAVMDFSYQNAFSDYKHPNAYERVLVDAIRGDHTLFATSQEVMSTWRVLQPILDEWAKHSQDLIIYSKGASGLKVLKSFDTH